MSIADNFTTLDGFALAAYVSVLVVYGVWIRHVRDYDDYAVASRRLPALVGVASLSATFIGPGYSLGLAGRASAEGWLPIVAFLGFSVQTVLVGLYVAPRLNQFRSARTVGDVMTELYGGAAGLLTGVLSVGLCVAFAAVMARAGGVVVSNATSMSLPLAVGLTTGVGVLYTVTGGLRAVIATEALQFTIVVAAVGVMLWFLGGSAESLTELSEGAGALTQEAFSSVSPALILGGFLAFGLGEMLIPPYSNRALAADGVETSRSIFVWTGLFSVVWFAAIIGLGIMARAHVAPDLDQDLVLLTAAAEVLPAGILGVLLAAVASIVMSTQESLLNAGAVSLTTDVLERIRPGFASVTVARIGTVFLGVGAVVIGLQATSILDALLVCYALWAPTVLPAFVWGLMGGRTSPALGLGSMLAGGVTSGAVLFVMGMQGGATLALLYGLAANLITGAIITLRTRGDS